MTTDTVASTVQIATMVKPFIITKNATDFNTFIEKVFGAQEIKAARTMDDDGLLIHSEFQIGDSVIMVIDTKDGWIFTPSLLQVYVNDTESTLQRAKDLGATVVTEPTDFYGDIFTRFQDPWNNLWWLYQYGGDANDENTSWDGDGWDEEPTDGDEAWTSEADPEMTKNLNYLHDTFMAVMKKLGTSA